ncbi:hypothetical protein ACQHIV_04420 [Kribbella sp. GL6]|uniref:hypothetical protein n=1 Tax=Kribbella sp. GL6 TaxID=3419765 RepID=UPI003D03FB6B
MTAIASPATQRLTVDGIRAGVAPVLERLAAAAREREGTRDYPFEEVRALAEQRITLIGVAVEDGGAGGTLRDVVELVIAIGRADSNVAQALRSSFLTAASVIARRDLPHRDRTLERLRNGDLFAGTANERGGAAGAVATRLLRKGDGQVISGAKYYSTGGLFAQWFGGTATDEDGKIVRFTIPTDREGVERLDDFDAIGQRLTASGTTRLNDVRVYPDELIRADEAPPRNPWQGSFAQLYLASIEAGIAGAALDDAVEFAREKARPIKHSTADRAVDDPYVRHVIGEIAARANAARAVVLLAAEELGAVPTGALQGPAAGRGAAAPEQDAGGSASFRELGAVPTGALQGPAAGRGAAAPEVGASGAASARELGAVPTADLYESAAVGPVSGQEEAAGTSAHEAAAGNAAPDHLPGGDRGAPAHGLGAGGAVPAREPGAVPTAALRGAAAGRGASAAEQGAAGAASAYELGVGGAVPARELGAGRAALVSGAPAADIPADPVRVAGARAAVAVAQAQYVAVEAALRAGELVFDVGGGSATDRGTALDRHWRNARTVANHNPRNWKAAVVGGFHLTGDEPPTSGLF